MGCICKQVEIPVEGVDNIDIKNEDDQKLTATDTQKEETKPEEQQPKVTPLHKESHDLDRSIISDSGKRRKKSKLKS